MQLDRWYSRKRFSVDAIKVAHDTAQSLLSGSKIGSYARNLERGRDDYHFDSSDEFFTEYRSTFDYAYYRVTFEKGARTVGEIGVSARREGTRLSVRMPERSEVMSVINAWEGHEESAKVLKSADPPRVFIGHGRSPLWRDLKDHLHEQHGYEVEAFETGARAGHATRDVLEQMLDKSSFAFLVLTGEDETADGQLRARQNVVHEAGLFQGKLGFPRAILVVEDGVESFSNMAGVQEIRFGKGNIREAFGDVLSTLRAALD